MDGVDSTGVVYYTVQTGDTTLEGIALKNSTTVNSIKRLNKLPHGFQSPWAGQKLIMKTTKNISNSDLQQIVDAARQKEAEKGRSSRSSSKANTPDRIGEITVSSGNGGSSSTAGRTASKETHCSDNDNSNSNSSTRAQSDPSGHRGLSRPPLSPAPAVAEKPKPQSKPSPSTTSETPSSSSAGTSPAVTSYFGIPWPAAVGSSTGGTTSGSKGITPPPAPHSASSSAPSSSVASSGGSNTWTGVLSTGATPAANNAGSGSTQGTKDSSSSSSSSGVFKQLYNFTSGVIDTFADLGLDSSGHSSGTDSKGQRSGINSPDSWEVYGPYGVDPKKSNGSGSGKGAADGYGSPVMVPKPLPPGTNTIQKQQRAAKLQSEADEDALEASYALARGLEFDDEDTDDLYIRDELRLTMMQRPASAAAVMVSTGEGSTGASPAPSANPIKVAHEATNANQRRIDRMSVVLNAPHEGNVLTYALARRLHEVLPITYKIEPMYQVYSLLHNGADQHSFYAKVAGYKPSLLIVETTDGDVFGGYATAEWHNDKTFYGSGECFVFSFANVPQRIDAGNSDKNSESAKEGGSSSAAGSSAGIASRTRSRSRSESNVVEESSHDSGVGGGGGSGGSGGLRMQYYPWAMENDFFMWSDEEQVSMGGGGDGFAFVLSRDFNDGTSSTSGTYANAPLAINNATKNNNGPFSIRNVEVWAFTAAPVKSKRTMR